MMFLRALRDVNLPGGRDYNAASQAFFLPYAYALRGDANLQGDKIGLEELLYRGVA